MATAAQITDRAKRYRAQGAVTGKKICVICRRKPKRIDVMHLDGNESHGEKENLAYGCRSCNAKLAAAFKSIGAGRPTNQYNPSSGVPSFQQYAWAVSQQKHSGEHGEYGAIIHRTPKRYRAEYAKRILREAGRKRQEAHEDRWNPSDASAEVYEEFHGHGPREVVTIIKKVHTHEHLASAGTLRKLVVLGIDKRKHTIRDFGGALLAFNEDKNQLFVEGGDQSLNLDDYGIKSPHEMETLGKVQKIDYHANKTHLGSEGGKATYTHKFRTTNENGAHVTVSIARYPDLIYDVRNEQLLFSGGSYTIRAEGIDV